MLNPADDYITAFVKEVNRGRVIHVETIMHPLGAGPQGDRQHHHEHHDEGVRHARPVGQGGDVGPVLLPGQPPGQAEQGEIGRAHV